MASKAGEGERTEGAWRVSLPKTVGAPRAQERTKLAVWDRSGQFGHIWSDRDKSGRSGQIRPFGTKLAILAKCKWPELKVNGRS